MSDEAELTVDAIRRQADAYLRSLRAAGVEWLPRGPRLTGTVRAPSPASFPVPAQGAASGASAAPIGENADPLEERRQALKVLAADVAKCHRCPELASTRTQTVFADGGPGAELCLIGEAPGADEDAQGIPFVGAAGQLLNRILAACGLRRDEVYVCNILKCRPPGNRTPLPNEADNCKGFLERQIELAQPKFICCLGSTAATNLLGTTKSLGQLRGRFHDYRGIPTMVTYHPSYLLPHRHPEKKRDVWEDMKTLIARMGRTLPEKPV